MVFDELLFLHRPYIKLHTRKMVDIGYNMSPKYMVLFLIPYFFQKFITYFLLNLCLRETHCVLEFHNPFYLSIMILVFCPVMLIQLANLSSKINHVPSTKQEFFTVTYSSKLHGVQFRNLITRGLLLHVQIWFHDKRSAHQTFVELLLEQNVWSSCCVLQVINHVK